MPLLKPDLPGRVEPPLKIHLRKQEGGLAICGLMWPDGESTDEPANVTCERCISIMESRARRRDQMAEEASD